MSIKTLQILAIEPMSAGIESYRLIPHHLAKLFLVVSLAHRGGILPYWSAVGESDNHKREQKIFNLN